jgi:hypothetical protein
MAGTLHIVRSAGAPHPWDLLAQQASATESCTIVLIQDAVGATPALPCPTFALRNDAQTRGTDTPYPLITDERLLEMIWGAERVVVW